MARLRITDQVARVALDLHVSQRRRATRDIVVEAEQQLGLARRPHPPAPAAPAGVLPASEADAEALFIDACAAIEAAGYGWALLGWFETTYARRRLRAQEIRGKS
jgi:hypothetical protein